MDASTWRRVNELLDQVEGMPDSERDIYLQRACHGDRRLESEVRALLESTSSSFLGDDESSDATEEVDADLLRNEPPSLAGKNVLGPFVLIKRLGSGGSGSVYEALHSRMNRRVALKVLSPDSVDDELRMEREARAVGGVSHPGIAAVYDFGKSDGRCWISMELVPGHNLEEEIVRQTRGDRRKGSPALPDSSEKCFVSSRVSLVGKVARALHQAHKAGIVHRDIKPGNIVLSSSVSPVIVDFGLARRPADVTITATGAIPGTLRYMSPEQIRGAYPEDRTDIYSLGVVLFQLLTGVLPFTGRQEATVADSIQHGRTPLLREFNPKLSADLEAICAMAMDKEATRRYPSARALADDLDRFLQFEPVLARPINWAYHLGSWARRKRAALLAVAGILFLTTTAALLANQKGAGRGMREAVQSQIQVAEKTLDEYDEGQSQLGSLLAVHQTLGDLAGKVEPPEQARLSEVGRRISLISAGESVQAASEIDLARGEEAYDPVDERRLLAALNRRRLAAEIGGSTARRAESDFPLVSLSTDTPGDVVRLYPADLLAGQFVDQTDLVFQSPLEGVPIAPGFYRVVVERPGLGRAELSRWFGEWGHGYDLGLIPVVPDVVAMQGMVLFQPGTQRVVLPILVDGEFPVRSFEHPAFYLDAHEVTNADYLEFVQAHPNAGVTPMHWNPRPGDGEWLARPVAGVSWTQSREYAEWRGKRLPTELEWSRAALGPDGNARPWGSSEELPDDLVVARYEIGPTGTVSGDYFERYLEFTKPVMQTASDVTPEGVYDLAGNVSEWVDSIALGAISGRLYPIATHRKSKGWNWMARQPMELASYEGEQAEAPFWRLDRGFRCAKSEPNQEN